MKITIRCLCLLAGAALLAACTGTRDETWRESASASVRREGNAFHLSYGPLNVEVVPQIGGRIASVQYREQELLLTDYRGENLHAWGNVLWPSPQSDWGWPPLSVLDSEPYAVARDGARLVLTSQLEPKLGYQLTKAYHFNDEGVLVIDYRLTNQSGEYRRVAPWEITRVPPSGLVLFPAGNTETHSGNFLPIDTDTRQGITRYEYDPSTIEGNHKLMTDGSEGWLAYVNQGLALVKSFPDVPASRNAPGEGEIEIYTDGDKTYMEVEQQGRFTTLAPGAHLTWQVQWHISPVPDDLNLDKGSELPDWIRQLIRRSAAR